MTGRGRFQGQTVLVTGASRGLGAAIAEAFAAEGAAVGVGYRVQVRKAEAVAHRIERAGGRAHPIGFDVADRAAVNAGVAAVVAALGGIDVLVHNAAITRSEPFALDDPEVWDHVIDVDLKGAANCARAVVRPMLARGGGAIVNVASVAGLRVSAAQSAYSAAKAGLLSLTRALGAELGPNGIRVNAVVPGLLDVGMGARTPQIAVERWLEHVPAGRAGRADEVVPAVLFLASRDASYIQGHALVVDGGLSL
jgi:3-oxoacyl-[acyl-carrier protein] reductase